MSSFATWDVNLGTVVAKKDDGSGGVGCGNSKHLYVGRSNEASTARRNYTSYLRFALDWTGVGRIVSATLVVYTDDFNGRMPPIAATDTPKITVARLTSAFTEGSNADNTFDSSDFTGPSRTTSNQKVAAMSHAVGGLNRIDITGIVEDWAPANVRKRNGTPGGKAGNYGIGLYGTAAAADGWSGWAEEHDPSNERPTIELVYELGPTVPLTPTNLSPVGAQTSLAGFQGDFSDTRASDTLEGTSVQVFRGTTTEGTVSTAGNLIASRVQPASAADKAAARSNVDPGFANLRAGTTYKWRMKQTDQEGQVSPWTTLQSFTISNTAPDAPGTLRPAGTSYASLNGVLFSGTYHDTEGDGFLAYQVQLSAFPEGDARWDEADGLLWDTGKVLTSDLTSTAWETAYGGADLAAGTYHWRARVYDVRGGLSAYAYSTVVLTSDFDVAPGSQTSVQLDTKAPWRIVIRDMYQADGVTKTAGRGPGQVVAILENAHSIGASKVHNSPGELHFTLGIDHPQIAVIEPKQTHYSVQFYSGDGWREQFAGLIWEMDATETDVVFKGLDYLALLDTVQDERYDASAPDKPSEKGGSYYVTAGKNTISYIITDQLNRARLLADSPVGFISVGSIATMDEVAVIYSTQAPLLTFVSGLIDSHRQGSGKKTRISVKRTTGGAYQFVVEDDPGVVRDDLRLRYGELIQGYRIIPFGPAWFSHVSAAGRSRSGVKVFYRSGTDGDAPGVSQSTYGRISTAQVFDGIADENDLRRRQKQAAIHAGKFGKSVAVGIRNGFLQPFDGYDICDSFPLDINHGAIDTSRFGSGYWTAFAVAWEAGDDGSSNTNITFQPREDTTAPNPDLIPGRPINTQAEWQIGWTPPPATNATSKYWLDQNTGTVYTRDFSAAVEVACTGVASTDLVTATAHGFSAGSVVFFGNLTGGADIVEGTPYYVIATGLTADAFKFSATLGGSAFNFTSDITDGVVSLWPEYTIVDDGTMSPPDPPAPPTGVTVIPIGRIDPDGTFVSGATVTMTHNSDPGARGSAIRVTHIETSPGVPDWDKAVTTVVAPDQTSLRVFGATPGAPVYVQAKTLAVFGEDSAWTTAVNSTALTDTTAPGVPTSLAAAAGIKMALVSWLKVTDADLSHYDLAISSDGGSTYPTVHAIYTTVAAISDLDPAITYKFKVRAVDTSGNASAYTTAVSAQPRKVTGSGLSGTDIEALSIAGADIKAATITAAKITAGTITANEIAADTITAANIAASAITSSELAANAVIAGKIAAGTIVTGDLNATCSISLVSNAGATVVIDSTGITITNGKLTIKDEFNTSVIGASGFASDWVDYISLGLYNGRFLSGVAGALTNGRSAKLPYWTVADSVGTAIATFVANGGVQVKFSALSDKKSFTSDAVPVGVNVPLHPTFTVSTHQGGGTLFLILQAYVDWFAWDMTPISTTTLASTSYSGTLSNTLINVLEVVRAPALAFYAKLRFTVEESSIGTHNALNSLTILAAGLKEVPAYQFNGTAFPSSPATNDKFFRTDLGMDFYWDGSQWLSTQLFKAVLQGFTANLAATATNVYFAAAPYAQGGSDIYFTDVLTRFFVVSGGTALGASHKWVGTLKSTDATAGGATTTTLATISIAAGASNAWRGDLTSILAAMGARYKLSIDWTKTGTPGALQSFTEIHYRVIAT